MDDVWASTFLGVGQPVHGVVVEASIQQGLFCTFFPSLGVSFDGWVKQYLTWHQFEGCLCEYEIQQLILLPLSFYRVFPRRKTLWRIGTRR